MNENAVRRLADDWISAGVAEGDTILVHSNLLRTLKRIAKIGGSMDPNHVIRSFLQAIGKSGTALFPLFNFGFTKGLPFSIQSSPSEMGTLTEAARRWPGAVRTGHPIYSFAVIGAKIDMFQNLKNFSAYGDDSPFGVLHRLNGKIGVIDLPDQHSMTFYHYVEESQEVPYRYHKTFTGSYTDSQGLETTETFGLFVRKLEDGVMTHVDPMGEILWEKGIYKGFRPGVGCGMRVASASAIFDEVVAVLRDGRAKGTLYECR